MNFLEKNLIQKGLLEEINNGDVRLSEGGRDKIIKDLRYDDELKKEAIRILKSEGLSDSEINKFKEVHFR